MGIGFTIDARCVAANRLERMLLTNANAAICCMAGVTAEYEETSCVMHFEQPG